MVMPDLRSPKALSSGDALFLYLEREGAPLSVAAIADFEGHLPLDLCAKFIESKLPLIPRYRQRVVVPPLNMGLPVWEFDPNFDIRNHVHEVTLKRGTDGEFKAAAGRVLSTMLRRDRPLWDFTLVHGLKGNRTGAIIRIHHCLADGISGVGILNTLLDPSPFVSMPKNQQKDLEVPAPRPQSIVESLVNTCLTSLERALTVQTDLLEMGRHFLLSAAQPGNGISSHSSSDPTAAIISTFEEINRLTHEFGAPTERLPFNVVCRGPQTFNWACISLAEMKEVKNACEATINDVVLTVVSAAVRRYAEMHGMRMSRRMLRIIVPVNLRGNGDANVLGNRITFLPVDIPLYISDPKKHLQAVQRAVARARGAKMAELISIVGTLVETIPTPLQAMCLPLLSHLPLSVCNMICTNVPGPPIPLYLLGHKMLACYPYVPIGSEMGMNCAVLSYNENVHFGFGGDAYAIPDQKVMEKFLLASFAELRKATAVARVRKPPVNRKPKPSPKVEPVNAAELDTIRSRRQGTAAAGSAA